jgi:hypothetical protein
VERGSKKRGERRERRREEEEGGPSSSLLLSLLALLFLPPLSLLPLPPTHCLSPSFISILLLTTSPPSFLSIHFLTTYLPPSSQSSSLPLSLLLPLLYFSPSLLSSSYYLSPFFLSFLLTDLHQRNNTCVVPHSEHPQS